MTWYVVTFAAGVVCGMILLTALLVAWADRDRRSARTLRRQVAFRDWCERVGWCPAHDRPDGSCPRVEINRYEGGLPVTRFEECPGSAVLRPPAEPTATGSRLHVEMPTGREFLWTYTNPDLIS